jgi:hypothetical protein
MTDTCVAVLPAWSATSSHNLGDPSLGFAAAKNAIAPVSDPWQARQSAMARYSRTGFEAAAVTAVGIALAARMPGRRREAELRFGHPYAVVAITTDAGGDSDGGAGDVKAGRSAASSSAAGNSAFGRGRAGRGSAGPGPWHGLPVFSAWVSMPEDATDDGASAGVPE